MTIFNGDYTNHLPLYYKKDDFIVEFIDPIFMSDGQPSSIGQINLNGMMLKYKLGNPVYESDSLLNLVCLKENNQEIFTEMKIDFVLLTYNIKNDIVRVMINA
ncbi:MAG: hypothetical protein IPL55_07385 [Saprospiraceae bacterium]|nr:hypothetical protein [Saprospiraceae bacterium]